MGQSIEACTVHIDDLRILEIIKDIDKYNGQDFKDYDDLYSLYDYHIRLNQLLSVACFQRGNSNIEKYQIGKCITSLIPIDKMEEKVKQLVGMNNELIKILNLQVNDINIDTTQFKKTKSIDIVAVYKVLYENLSLCLKMKDTGIPIEIHNIYTGIKPEMMSRDEMCTLYYAVIDSNEQLSTLLKIPTNIAD